MYGMQMIFCVLVIGTKKEVEAIKQDIKKCPC